MNLGIIGCGAIGTDVALAADEMKEIEKIYLQDIDRRKAVNREILPGMNAGASINPQLATNRMDV